jgi:putative Mn2+ efflux pump MntP
VLTIFLVAISVGLGNFAGAIGIGLNGLDARLRIRVVVVFGVFEAGMPVAGLLLSHSLAKSLGSHAGVIGGVILILTGLYGVVTALRTRRKDAGDAESFGAQGLGRLVVTAAALSIDNLAIGFALGTYHVSLVTATVTIAVVSVGLSLIGLELGSRIGTRVGEYSELLGGGVLIGVGILLGVGVI